MAINVSSGNFTVTSGTHTWAEVVTALQAAGATTLTVHDAVNNVFTYTGYGVVDTGGDLTGNNITLHLRQVNAGENTEGCLHTKGNGSLKLSDSLLTLTKLRGYNQQPSYSQLAIQSTTSTLELVNCGIRMFADLAASVPASIGQQYRVQIYPTLLDQCKISDASVQSARRNLIIQYPGGSITATDSVCPQSTFEIAGPGASAARCSFLSVDSYREGTTRTLATVSDVVLANPHNQASEQLGVKFVNTANALKTSVNIFDTTSDSQYGRDVNSRSVFSHDLKLIDASGNVENALVLYDGFDDFTDTSDSSGLVSFELLNSEYDPTTLGADDGGFSSYTRNRIDRSSYVRIIKSYAHLFNTTNITADSQLGTAAQPLELGLLVDTGITVTNTATVATYSGISRSGNTYTFSGTLSLSQVYDWMKLQWSNNDGVTVPTQQGTIADFGNAGITISAGSNSPSITTKYQQFTTTGIITLSAAGTYLNGHVPATGTVLVQAGETFLPGWTFAPGAVINKASGSASVFVDPDQIANVTGGTGVTITSTRITFSGFPTGNNVNGVAYNAVISIRNTSDNTLFAAYTGGATYSKSLANIGNGVGPFEVWGDGVGLRRTISQTIPSDRTEPVSLTGLFEEFKAEDGTVLVGLAAADDGVIYQQTATRFEFTGAPHTFLGALHQFDLLTSAPSGQEFNNTLVRNITFISNKYGNEIQLPAPLTVAATANAASSPTLLDFLITRLGDPGADLFERGLSSTVSGYTSRPEVRVNSTRFISSEASSGGTTSSGFTGVI